MAYRVAICQMCRDEGLDLNMVMSCSGGGIAQLAPPAMSALPGRFDADQTAIWREHQEGEEGHADLQTDIRADEGEDRHGDGQRRGHVQWRGPSASTRRTIVDKFVDNLAGARFALFVHCGSVQRHAAPRQLATLRVDLRQSRSQCASRPAWH